MKEQKILDHIHNSIDNMTPNIAEEIFYRAEEAWNNTKHDTNNAQLDDNLITLSSSQLHTNTKQNTKKTAAMVKSI